MTIAALDPIALPLSGTSLVEASAGTGKTHAIATLFVRLLLERGLGVDEILVVTFTEAAAAELRDRIRQRLRIAVAIAAGERDDDRDLVRLLQARRAAGHLPRDLGRLVEAVRAFDLAHISTIHGFCHQVLGRSAFETGVALHTELVADEGPLVEAAIADFWARELVGADKRFVRYLAEHAIDPTRSMRLARLVAAHPELPIVPEIPDVLATPDISAYVLAYREARRIWNGAADEIRAQLSTDVLHRGQYKRDELPAMLAALDVLLRPEDPPTLLDEAPFSKLTSSRLVGATRQGQREHAPRHAFFDACQAMHEARGPIARHYEARIVAFKWALVQFVRRELPRRKRVAGLQSFDDLLQRLDEALRGRTGRRLAEQIRRRHRAALIDEFQDTDPVQYRIFRAIFGARDTPMLLIGDPKQAIYAFRGADVFAYLEAARHAGKRRVTMAHNWRSDPELVAAVGRLFAVAQPFLLADIGYPPVEPRPGARTRLFHGDAPAPGMIVHTLDRAGAPTQGKYRQIAREWLEREIPARIAAEIARVLAGGTEIDDGGGRRPVHAGDIAVLTRRNAQAQQIQEALRTLAIPSVVYGDATVFDTREARELARVLAAAAEPTREGLVRAALATELLGVEAAELDRLDDDDGPWDGWVDVFRRLHELWTSRGFVQMLRELWNRTGAQRRLLMLRDGERRMTNLLHLGELLHAAASEQHLGPIGLLRWFDDQRRLRTSYVDSHKLRLERDDHAVQLITIHRSKGLEYPIVFCPYLWEGDDLRTDEKSETVVHDPAHEHRLTLDIRRPDDPGKTGSLSQARLEHDAEALRLCYVAVTRARHQCNIVWAPGWRANDSALAYLFGAPGPDEPARERKAISAAMGEIDDASLHARIVARGAGTWSVRPLAPAGVDPLPPTIRSSSPLHARTPRAVIDRLYRTSSFSHMASTQLAAPLFVDFADARASDEAIAEAGAEVLAPAPEPARAVALAAFPRGVAAGNFFHDLLEHLDFRDPDPRALVEATLRGHGFAPETWSQTVQAALAQILATPLDPARWPDLRLGALERRDRRDELEFLIPVADADGALGRRALAQVFRDHPEGLPAGYGDRITQLGFPPLRGFLKGFIDLVFVHRGRYFVVDYKTNHLGDDLDDYTPERIAIEMARDHYVLQYHLYSVALCRWLAARLPDFDHERHFGGVYYLFLRGMDPTRPDRGVYRERPSAQRIAALSRLLTHGGGG